MTSTENKMRILMGLASTIFIGCSKGDEASNFNSVAETLQQSSAPSFNYIYTSIVSQSPPTAGQTCPLLRPASVSSPSAIAASVANALSIGGPLSPGTRDAQRGLSRFQLGRRWVEIAERSGSILYTNLDLYNGDAVKDPPDAARALALSDAVIARLDHAGIVKRSEVMWSAPHISHRYHQEGPGGSPVGPYVAPMPPRKMDTRVRYQRMINNVPISGSYIRIVFSDSEEVSNLRVLWRPVTVDPDSLAKPVVLANKDARTAFESSTEFSQLPTGARIDVSVDEFIYEDGSKYDAVNFLEPGYMFLYVVKTPILDDPDRFVVSKKIYRFLAATAHDETQLPSMEAARLAAQSAAGSQQGTSRW